VEELRAAGTSVVLTTHYLDEAERLADHVVVLDAGRVVAAGTPTELTRGGAERSLRFRAVAGLDVAALAASLHGRAEVSERQPSHYVVEGDVDPALLAAVTAWCAEQGVLIDDLRVEQRSLEDVFLELTGDEVRP
jgi:ABC-2 type transport system ATP-binding protein